MTAIGEKQWYVSMVAPQWYYENGLEIVLFFQKKDGGDPFADWWEE
jgi:hypothetical protein